MGLWSKLFGDPPQHGDNFAAGFLHEPDYTFKNVWERKRLPDEGTLSYAYETLALYQTTPIGPGVSVRQPDPVRIFTPPSYESTQALAIAGIPLQAGMLYGQPLFDASGNPVDVPGAEPIPAQAGWNLPIAQMPLDYRSPGLPNVPFPQHIKGL
jgi:hypothetical protein